MNTAHNGHNDSLANEVEYTTFVKSQSQHNYEVNIANSAP